jgi:hypothetical protein
MPIDSATLAILQALTKPAVAAYWMVVWNPDDPSETRYYSDQAYSNYPPFLNIGVPVEARLLENPYASTQFEINPDLRTETIGLAFNDIDKEITGKFQTFKSGVRAELFFYYPQVDLTFSIWFGQLQAPQIYGHRILQCNATNGFRSREQMIPKRMRPRECTANFGGRLPSAFALASNGCPYDRHLGGATGNLNPVTSQPYIDCPRLTQADCFARLGRGLDNTFFLGFNTDASATVTDQRSGYIAVSKGNESALKQPIRVIAGTKYLRGLQLLLWRREINAQTNDHGFIRGIWEVGEGPIKSISNFKIIEKIIEFNQQWHALGFRGQVKSGYSALVSNFSSTAYALGVYGRVNPLSLAAKDLSAECNVIGFANVYIPNDITGGNGLIGNYYTDTEWTALQGQRVDSNINFPSTTADPFPGIHYAGFSVKWTGRIKPRYSETYTFTAIHDDAISVTIDGDEIINWGTFGTTTGTKALTADTEYDIEIKLKQIYSEDINNTWGCTFKWQSTSQALEVVPNSRLFYDAFEAQGRQWTDDRAWWLLECYTNQKWGMGNPLERFWVDDYKSTSNWGRDSVSFTLNGTDGEADTYTGRRTTFDAALEGRSVAEQVLDICRSGSFSVPFQYEGKYTITPFTTAPLIPQPGTIEVDGTGSGSITLIGDAATEDIAAATFYDAGPHKNIIWADGQPAITLQQTPDDLITNEIILTFEEASNYDVERPITVDDPNQKLRAGRVLGEDNLQSVPRRDSAFGCRYLQEVIRLGYRALRFGYFDEGGIENNLRATFTVPFEQALGVRRYQIIKIVSTLLDPFTIGTNNGVDDFTEAPEYFRVLRMSKLSNGLVQIIAQAYNQTAYEAFETVTTPGTGAPAETPDDPPEIIPPTEPILIGTLEYDSALNQIVIPLSH